MKKCYHIFESDGGQCIKCRKTASELLEEKRDDLIMKLTPSQIEKQDKKALKAGFFDWNVLTLDQMVEYLEEKHKFSSTGESKCIFELIDFYKKHK